MHSVWFSFSNGQYISPAPVRRGQEHGVDLFGQGTWRANAERLNELGYIWTAPTLSEDVQFVTTAPQRTENTIKEQMFIFAAPFSFGAWVAIFGAAFLYWSILVLMEKLDSDHPISAADRELSYIDLAYGAIVSLTGEHQIDAVTNLMRVLQSGWIYLVFILGAGKTAHTGPPAYMSSTTLAGALSRGGARGFIQSSNPWAAVPVILLMRATVMTPSHTCRPSTLPTLPRSL